MDDPFRNSPGQRTEQKARDAVNHDDAQQFYQGAPLTSEYLGEDLTVRFRRVGKVLRRVRPSANSAAEAEKYE
jgi:hypothetical protein